MELETAGRSAQSIIKDTTEAGFNIGVKEKTEDNKEGSSFIVSVEQSMSMDVSLPEAAENTQGEKMEGEKKSENISSATNSQPIWLSSVLYSKGPRAYGIRPVGDSQFSSITSTNATKTERISVSKMTDRGANLENINTALGGTRSSPKKGIIKTCEKTGDESVPIDTAVCLPTKSREDQNFLQSALPLPSMHRTRDQLRHSKLPKPSDTSNPSNEAKTVHKVRSDRDLVSAITEVDQNGFQDLNCLLKNQSEKQMTPDFSDGNANPGNPYFQRNESTPFFNSPVPMFIPPVANPFGFTPLPNVPIPGNAPKFYGKYQWKGETQAPRVDFYRTHSLEQRPFDLQEQRIHKDFAYPTSISSYFQDMSANEKYSAEKGGASYMPFTPSSFHNSGFSINPPIIKSGPWSSFGTTVSEPHIVPEPLESPRKKVKAPNLLKELQKQSSLDDTDGLRKLRLKAARNRAKAAIQSNRESIGISSSPGNSSRGNSFPGPDTSATFQAISQRDSLYPQSLTTFSDTLPSSPPNLGKTIMPITSFSNQRPQYLRDLNKEQPMYMESYGNRPLQSYNLQATGNNNDWGFREGQIGAISVGHSSTGPMEIVPDRHPVNGLKIEIPEFPEMETSSEKAPSNVDSFIVDDCTLDNISASPTVYETDFLDEKREDKTLMEVSRRLLGDEESMEEMEEKHGARSRGLLSSNTGSQCRSTEMLDVNALQNGENEKSLEELLVKDVEGRLENCLKEGSHGNNGVESSFEAVLQLDLDNSHGTSKNEPESEAKSERDCPLTENLSTNCPSSSERRYGYKLNGMSFKSLLVEDSGEQNNMQNTCSFPARLPSSNSQTSSIRSAGDSGSFSEEEAGWKGENENGDESCMDGVGGENQRKGFLFEKSLTKTDTGGLGRIILPKKATEKYLPLVNHKEGVNVEMGDGYGRIWVFRLRFWQNKSRMYVLEGAGDYMRAHHLQVGDRICFCQCDEGKLFLLPIKGLNTLPPSFSSSSTTPPTSSSQPSPSLSLLTPEASSQNAYTPFGSLPPCFDTHTNNTNSTTSFHVSTCFPPLPPPPLPLLPPPAFLVSTISTPSTLFPSQTTVDLASPSQTPSPSPSPASCLMDSLPRSLGFPQQSYFDNFPSHRRFSQLSEEICPENFSKLHPKSLNSCRPYSTTPQGIETSNSGKLERNSLYVGANPLLRYSTVPSSVTEQSCLPPFLSHGQLPSSFPRTTEPSGIPPNIPTLLEDKPSHLNPFSIPRVRLKSGGYLPPEIVVAIMQRVSISKRKISPTCDQSEIPFPFISDNSDGDPANLENLSLSPSPSPSPSPGPTDLTLGNGGGSSSSVELETNAVDNNSLSDVTPSEVMADCGVFDDPELAALLAGEENDVPDASECNNSVEAKGQTLERCPSLTTTEACLALMGSFDLPINSEPDFPKIT